MSKKSQEVRENGDKMDEGNFLVMYYVKIFVAIHIIHIIYL